MDKKPAANGIDTLTNKGLNLIRTNIHHATASLLSKSPQCIDGIDNILKTSTVNEHIIDMEQFVVFIGDLFSRPFRLARRHDTCRTVGR